MMPDIVAENIAAELRFVVSAIRRAIILSRGIPRQPSLSVDGTTSSASTAERLGGLPLVADLARLREFAEATLDLVEKDDLGRGSEFALKGHAFKKD